MITRSQAKRRNWLSLPTDVMIQIFIKVGIINLIFNAQRVCKSWRSIISQEPQLYRIIDMRDPKNPADPDFQPSEGFVKWVIGKSHGKLEEFSLTYFCTDNILYKIMSETPRLRCLRLRMSYQVGQDCFLQVIQKLPLLEEVEICYCPFTEEVIKAVGRYCPNLKSFRVNHRGIKARYPPPQLTENVNREVTAITGSMSRGLRSLHLFGNLLDNKGVIAILKRFPRLEYLDLRQCFNVVLEGDLLRRCRLIRGLRLPNDSTDDYEFDASIVN